MFFFVRLTKPQVPHAECLMWGPSGGLLGLALSFLWTPWSHFLHQCPLPPSQLTGKDLGFVFISYAFVVRWGLFLQMGCSFCFQRFSPKLSSSTDFYIQFSSLRYLDISTPFSLEMLLLCTAASCFFQPP